MPSYLAGIFLLVNLIRPTPLVQTPQLNAIAQNRAEYICNTGKFSHENYEAFLLGFKKDTLVGENLALGFDGSAFKVVSAWIGSKAHRENLLNPRYHFTGLGSACGYTVELFTE